MSHPLMPKATAVWLVENTTLGFDQIAAFCELHPLEVQGIADGEVAIGIVGNDPVAAGELTMEEIERCAGDTTARLVMSAPDIPPQRRRTGPRYTPVAKRQNRPEAISWLLKYHSELADVQICKLVGTTKPTINSVRDRTHWNTPNINPTDPVSLGMCSQTDLDTAIQTAVTRLRRKEERDRKAAAKKQREKAAAAVAAETAAAEAATAAAESAAPESSVAESSAAESSANEAAAAETPSMENVAAPEEVSAPAEAGVPAPQPEPQPEPAPPFGTPAEPAAAAPADTSVADETPPGGGQDP